MARFFLKLSFILSLFLLVSCDKEIFTGLPDEPAPTNGKIFIQSNPPKATIYYNKRNMGLTTPDSLVWLNNGVQSITLKMDLFKDTTFNMTADDKKMTSIFIDYYLNPGHYGKIDCNSDPWGADIYINGLSTGQKTRSTLSPYFPGYYKVKVTMKEHRADSTLLPVHGGKSNYVFFDLEDTTKWVTYKTSNSNIPADAIKCIAVDQYNTKWMTTDSALISFNGKSFKIYNNKNSILPENGFTKLLVDKKNNLWIATIKGLYLYDGNSFYNYSDKLPSIVVSSISCNDNGIIWFATSEGLVKYDGTSWKNYNTSNSGINGNLIALVSVGNDGTVWFLNYQIGSFDGVNWAFWDMSNMNVKSAIGLDVSDIKVDHDGKVWASHRSFIRKGITGGFTCYNGSYWSEIKFAEFSTTDINSIDIDANNYKWLGAQYGLGKFLQPTSIKKFYLLSRQVPAANVTGTVIDRNGDLWFITNGSGIVKIKNGNY
jgi:prepilin-type processing-associated H-X9-DG protein